MKQTKHSDTSITYMPCYKECTLGIVVISILVFSFVITSLLMFLDNITLHAFLIYLLVNAIAISLFFVIYRCISRRMYDKFVISCVGVFYSNKYMAIQQQILWNEVDKVYFIQDDWFGRRMCKFYLKNSYNYITHTKKSLEFVLLVNNVDAKKLIKFIPQELWKNDPQYAWYN